METNETEFIYSGRTGKQQHFDKRLINYIVGLTEQGVPRRDLVAQYGMSKCSLDNWIAKWSSLKHRRSYSPSEKRSVVRAIESGMSIREAQVSFNISSDKSIRSWLSQFKEENVELSLFKPIEVAKKTLETSGELELKALKKALEEEILKNKALNTMIDIAEQQLKIDIRKKSGARQSSK